MHFSSNLKPFSTQPQTQTSPSICFPPTGRIGFAFSLIEPDEMPYMVDVHTLLGKDVDASYNSNNAEGGSGSGDSGRISYTLESMTPDLVQTGRHLSPTLCYT